MLLNHTRAGERKRTQVKLIDFGLSRAEAFGAKLARSEMGGTPAYVAPEQIRGQAPQPSMDIYSLGVLTYEVLTGRLPFSGRTAELLDHHQNTPPSPPNVHLDEPLDERLEELVMGLLAKDPLNRPASMGQVVYQLRTLSEMLGLRPGRAPRTITTKVARKSKRELNNLRAVVDSCPCPLFRISNNAKLLLVNRAFCKLVRVEEDDLLGTPLDETRFLQRYPELVDKLELAVVAGKTKPLVKVATFGDGDDATSVRIVLVPEKGRSDEISYFSGIIYMQG